MSQVKYVRVTHENGRFRPSPTEAYQFWREQGWIVGEVLRLEQGMMLLKLFLPAKNICWSILNLTCCCL